MRRHSLLSFEPSGVLNLMKRLFLPAVLGLAGCSTLSVLLPETAPSDGGALEIRPAIRSGGFKTQALVSPYTSSNIDHLVVSLHVVNGANETPVQKDGQPLKATVASGSFDTPVTFTNLKRNLTYRIKARAYKAPGSADADLISRDASSSIDLKVENDGQAHPRQLARRAQGRRVLGVCHEFLRHHARNPRGVWSGTVHVRKAEHGT